MQSYYERADRKCWMIFVISYICVGQLRHIFVRFFFLEDRGKKSLRKVANTASLPRPERYRQVSLREHCGASVRPSVRMYHLGSHCTDLCEMRCSWALLQSVDKCQILLKSGENVGQFTWRFKCLLLCPGDTESPSYLPVREKCCRSVRLSD